MPLLTAVFAGFLFGLGLAVSNMMDPAKVLSFLDILGDWDPSLMLVMGGAVAVTLPGFRLVLKRQRPLFTGQFHLPTKSDIDRPLLAGAAIFGLGWGLAGLCPGPALAGLVTGEPRIIGFVIAMLCGYTLTGWLQTREPALRAHSTP